MRPLPGGARGVLDTQRDTVGHRHGYPATGLAWLPQAVSARVGAAEGAR